jgi:hypothetical protein
MDDLWRRPLPARWESTRSTVFVGVDGGKAGGIAAVHIGAGRSIMLNALPLPHDEETGLLQVEPFAAMLRSWAAPMGIEQVLIEDVQTFAAGGGRGTTMANYVGMGVNLGRMLATLDFLGLSWRRIAPISWQALMFRGLTADTNEGKARSLECIDRFFPIESFVPERCRRPHDGMVDAALIAISAAIAEGVLIPPEELRRRGKARNPSS